MTEEVKIYRQHGIKEPALSEGEKAAREYRRQQQNGNLERAHRLGENLCALFLGMPVASSKLISMAREQTPRVS